MAENLEQETKKVLNASVAPEEFDWAAFEGGDVYGTENKEEIEIRELEDDIYGDNTELQEEIGPTIMPDDVSEEEDAAVEDFDFDELELGDDDPMLDDDF